MNILSVENFTGQYVKNNRQNNLTDEKWVVIDKNTSNLIEIDLSFKNCSKKWALWGRKIILEWAGGYDDTEQNISANFKSLNAFSGRVYLIIRWATDNMGDKPLNTWGIENITNLLVSLIFNEGLSAPRKKLGYELDLRAYGTVRHIFRPLILSQKLYRQGKIHDGLTLNIPSDFVLQVAESEFESRGMLDKLADWIEGGSFAHIPIEVSITLLSEAIAVIRSPITNALIAYFKAQKSSVSLTIEPHIYEGYGSVPLIESLSYTKGGNTRKNYESWKAVFEQSFLKQEEFMQRTPEKTAYQELEHVKKLEDLNDLLSNIHEACVTIFLCLTGIRIHELSSIYSTDYGISPDGIWSFKASIHKTHNGVKQVRSMHGLVAEAAKTQCELSYIDKLSDEFHGNIKLFGRYDTPSFFKSKNKKKKLKPNDATTSTLSKKANRFYQKVISKLNFGSNENLPDKISSHGFRHAFADFSIRRFDGNVLEAIRQHFRHRHGSSFTRTYTNNKAEEELHDAAAKRYLRDLIRRMVGEHSNDFTGPMALHIRNEVNRLNIVSENELNAYIDSLSENLYHLVPHEYGFCLVLKERQHLAECKDKKTGLPNVDGVGFEKCSGCPNSFQSVESNKSNIERIVISHEAFLEKFPIKTKQHITSEKVVKQGLNILNNMGES